ncbi:MAG: DUF7793 family protein [Bacteroidia bacterium]
MDNIFENKKYKIIWHPDERYVEFYMKGEELDREDVIEMHKQTLLMTKGEKCANIFSAQDFFSISSEGREEGAKPYYLENLIVQAFVVKNLAQRLLGNFVMKFNQPAKETRMFTSVEEARKWVLVKVKEYEEKKKKNKDLLAV